MKIHLFFMTKHKNIQDPIENIAVKYQFHPSTLIIKNKIKNTNTFCFQNVMLLYIKNEIKGLNPNKATSHNNIHPKILRQSAEVTANTLQLLFNNAVSNNEFPGNLKLADVTPVFKKNDLDDKGFGGAVLMNLSKAFDTLNHELQLTLENSNCQGTKKIVRVIESSSFREICLKQ